MTDFFHTKEFLFPPTNINTNNVSEYLCLSLQLALLTSFCCFVADWLQMERRAQQMYQRAVPASSPLLLQP